MGAQTQVSPSNIQRVYVTNFTDFKQRMDLDINTGNKPAGGF